MNRERRKRLGQAFDKCAEIKEILESVKEEENEALENLPENFRYGEKGEEMENYIEMIDETIGYIEDAESVIEQI